jgi:DNA-binding LacI/PurR family transcriptional regulator
MDMSSEEKRITIKDIARMAGVSIGTVDRVLHRRGRVKAETGERIRKIIFSLHSSAIPNVPPLVSSCPFPDRTRVTGTFVLKV